MLERRIGRRTMPGVSLRDLLCCSAKSDDRGDSKPPRISPADPEFEKPSDGVFVNEIVAATRDAKMQLLLKVAQG